MVGGGLGRDGPGLLGLGAEPSESTGPSYKDAQGLFKLGPEEADISAEMLFVEWVPASSAHISAEMMFVEWVPTGSAHIGAEMLFVEWSEAVDVGGAGGRILLGVGK